MKIKPTSTPGGVVVELRKQDDRILDESIRAAEPVSAFKLRRILVPVDFSACSKKALKYAIPFARQFQATLLLLHVVPVTYAYGELGAIDFASLEKQMTESSSKELAELAKAEIPEELTAELVVTVGQPGNEIIRAAKEKNIDLIILSTHGYTGLKHIFMGSTTERVVRYAPCPVLTVREHEHEFVEG